MKKYIQGMNGKASYSVLRTYDVLRTLIIVFFVVFTSVNAFADGWTPTDGGLVVNLNQGDRILLSTWLDIDKDGEEDPGEELFVENYNRNDEYTYFNYEAGSYLKLLPQEDGATEPSEMSIWSVGAPLERTFQGRDCSLGGIVYTIWNDGKTLRSKLNSTEYYKFFGDLTGSFSDNAACDVVFVIPTDRKGIVSFDPERTLARGDQQTTNAGDDPKRKGRFNGKMGYNSQLGLYYREVYMLEIPRLNGPISYTNAAVVTFNTTKSNITTWRNAETVKPGHAAFAFSDDGYKTTTRTIFRLYSLDDPINSCSSYFFATDEQDYKQYRRGPGGKQNLAWDNFTDFKKIYTWDHFYCMEKQTDPKIYKSDWMYVPTVDSTYYYVGKHNTFVNKSNKGDDVIQLNPEAPDKAVSQFKRIDSLRVLALKDKTTGAGKPFIAPKGAYGRMVVDTTSTQQNLGVSFEPAGYFLKVGSPSGRNVPMVKTGENEWTTLDMWTLNEEWLSLSIKTTLMTGSAFSETDPGADVAGWSEYVVGNTIKIKNTDTPVSDGISGYAQITTNDENPNGNIVFVRANTTYTLSYNNNDFLGLEIPDQHPTGDNTFVIVQAPRIKSDYTFKGWTRDAAGTGKKYPVGDTIHLSEGTTTLYAQASYDGTLQIALSFMEGGKRYFVTYPSTGTYRYARARHFDNWDNTWQGMENADNLNPNYMSTFEMRYPSNELKAYGENVPVVERELLAKEKVLDPRRDTIRGYKDSLIFYEFFTPAKDEYMGLYYAAPYNTVLFNNTWAGLFESNSTLTTTGWPDYKTPYVPGVKLSSTRYVQEEDPESHPDSLTLKLRDNSVIDSSYVKYNSGANQFDGDVEANATLFDLSAIAVADEHYIILPDTSEVWRDTITFGYHKDEQISEDVWSKLIGKQLMAVMRVGDDTVYFHPNRNKVINDPNNLYLSQDFRMTETFELIPDARVTTVADSNRVTHEATSYHWHRQIVSGENSPMNVMHGGKYIDIIDTFRITLIQGGVSKVKGYRGRWKKQRANDGLTVNGLSRYRDVIIRTKTYHYGPEKSRLVFKASQDSYNFNALQDDEHTIEFTLTKETYQELMDAQGRLIGEEKIVDTKDTTEALHIYTENCTFSSTGGGTGSSYFDATEPTPHSVKIKTKAENVTGADKDVLTVTQTIRFNGKDTTVTATVSLSQAALEGTELVWSVKRGSTRYFIMAVGSGSSYTLSFRRFNLIDNTYYKKDRNDHLVKGSNAGDNTDGKYITPWNFTYEGELGSQQLSLTTLYGINKSFALSGEEGALGEPGSPTVLTYVYVNKYTNSNSNFEEQVKLKTDDTHWLKFDGTKLIRTTTESEASVFSWGYLLPEYSLLNNGAYPNQSEAFFEYNNGDAEDIQTRYMAYREYSMLLDNTLTYLCRKEETRIDSLTDGTKEWKTSYTITHKRDRRTFDDGASATSSGLEITTTDSTLITFIKPNSDSITSPRNVKIGGEYVNIVDTLAVTLSESAPQTYRFKEDWSDFRSISDANLKIPLVRMTYHTAPFDSLVCVATRGQNSYYFPAVGGVGENYTFRLSTLRRTGTKIVDVNNHAVAEESATSTYITRRVNDQNTGMHLNNPDSSEVRLIDEYGNTPSWCKIIAKGDSTVTVQCTQDGDRTPRSAYIYLAYIIRNAGVLKFVNYRLTVSQPGKFSYDARQTLIHSRGASDDSLAHGMQQVHENKRIIYYYPDEDIDLPVRERAFYGWWRWYREGKDSLGNDVGDTDVPDVLWVKPPVNEGAFKFPFRKIIVDSVWVDDTDHTKGKKLGRTMGRYTVFHYKSKDYNNKQNPPSKNPTVVAPTDKFTGKKPILTYAVDISNYYDRLPLSLSQKNQVDTKKLDTLSRINEPTLSLREIFELHPWTEMADMLEKYKYIESVSDNRDIGRTTYDSTYMEDHILMAPLDNKLLLRTEQRYSKSQLEADGFAEGLLGYYTHDDNWKDGAWSQVRKDSMIWCIGWDQDCHWYTYTPETGSYEVCSHSIKTEDILEIPAKKSISAGHEFDTVYYCLRARSKKTTGVPPSTETTALGDYWFNICRYMVIYHKPDKYGPKLEVKQKNGITKAIMTNDEIEETYEVLEKLNFDYNKPGSDYAIYPHPLPWADASYGFMYPETPNLPHNRYHDQSDFPNHGEYGLINRIPYSDYWKKMEQHGGAANGYMIYCDGMASAGQVAALHLETNLCAGQQMYFSGYVGNPSSQKSSSQDPVNGKSEPNFTFAVQASTDGTTWDNITEYTTGDIAPSDKWRQILFPINFSSSKSYTHFRVRIYNVASSFDGNDFVIDDMRLFATKPPLIAYQAQTKCVAMNEKKDSTTQVVLRIDYQGFTSDDYNGKDVYYTVQKIKGDDTAYVKMDDHYLNEKFGKDAPSVFGSVLTPTHNYMPSEEDSVFSNLTNLIEYVNGTKGEHKIGYIFENVNGIVRPVMYIIHEAKMTPDNVYKVRMSLDSLQLNSSICAMTSNLKVTNKMVLDLNGEERPDMEVSGMCANTTYDISMRVRGTLHLDSIAPIDLNGSCVNDWLVGGDTAKASSRRRYGFYYKDIVKVVKDILRCEPQSGKNINQFAPNLSSVSRNEMGRFWDNNNGVRLDTTGVHPYDILAHLVNNGHLILYQSKLTETVALNDSIEFVVMPILGTGSDAVRDSKIEVCPEPVYIKLKSTKGGHIPMSIGGAKHGETPVILAGSSDAAHEMTVRIDSLMDNVKLDTIITLRSTNDPGYLEGSHILNLVPDKTIYPGKGSMVKLRPARNNNYVMRGGYSYTFDITMLTLTGSTNWQSGTNDGCPVGTVPFTISVVPDQLRWEPKSKENNKWNNPDNWIGVTPQNVPIHNDAHFAPLSTSSVLIPTLADTLPYPYIPAPEDISKTDSVHHTGFEYNKCDVIRFMPGAAMAQQQNLTCTDAVIDMTMPNKKWALRAAPVEGMLTGDVYMSAADFAEETPLWEVGAFDISGRNYQTGNASFWLSLYNRSVRTRGKENNDTVAANAEWSKITNAMTLPLTPTQGFAVYSRTTSNKDAIVRLPKNDDIYYYYGAYGDRMDDYYEHDIKAKRNEASAGGNTAGKLAYRPEDGKQTFTLTNVATSAIDMLFFGNPTMGYIDIWGFIADNSALAHEIGYLDERGAASIYYTVPESIATATKDTITELKRYLPPMHVIALKLNSALGAGAGIDVKLYTNRIVTHPSQTVRPASAPSRANSNSPSKGIMTVTAINPVSARCKSRLQLGQGYHAAILDGEDALLTTLNIDNYTNNTTPATPFNIYAVEDNYGLCVDLRNQILNVPISFYMSDLPFAPTTQLWFTGVNNIDGELVLYDSYDGSERRILDGIRLDIETPEQNHEVRYYIRRRGFDPNDPTTPVATAVETNELEDIPVTKILRDGHVLIIRDGHIYTTLGQKLK